MPLEESEQITVVVVYRPKRVNKRAELVVTVRPGNNWSESEHLAYQAFLFSVRRLQIAVRKLPAHRIGGSL